MRAVVPTVKGSAGSPTSCPSFISNTPKGELASEQRPIISLYRSSKMWSGSFIPGNKTTLFSGKRGSSVRSSRGISCGCSI